MSSNNILFHDKIEKYPKITLIICFLGLWEEFPRDTKTGWNKPQLTRHRCSSN